MQARFESRSARISSKDFAARLISLFASVLFLVAVLVNPAMAADDAPANDAPIATADVAPTDVLIRKRIQGIFDEIEGLEPVFVTVRSGVVTLRGRVTETYLAEHAAQLAARVEGVVEVNNKIETVTEVTKRLAPVVERLRNRFAQVVNYVPLVIVSLVVFLITTAFGWWIAARDFPWSKIAPNAFLAELLRQVIRLSFLAAGILLALDILGATALLSTILGAAGIIGLAIGFAVRDTVENYIASILLSIRQPFRPMDYVDIDGTEGSVLGLTSRATILMDADGNHIRIPNSTVFKATILNYDRNPERRFTFEIELGLTGALDAALATGLNAIRSLEFVLGTPAPDAWIKDIDGSSVTLWFGGWVNQSQTSYQKARSEAIRHVKTALEKAGFAMPQPGYLVTLQDESGTGTRSKPGARKRTVKPPVAVLSEDESMDTSVDREAAKTLVNERARLSESDLLDDHAPQEIN